MALPTFHVSGNVLANTGPISLVWPSGHQANDLGLMFITTKAQAIATLPSGWEHIPGSPFSVGSPGASDAVALTVLWKRASSGSEPSLSIGDSGDHQMGSIQTYRGVTTSGDPWDQISSNVASTASSSVTIPGHTTTGTDRLVVHAVANAIDTSTDVFNGSFTNASLGSLAVRVNVNTTQGLGSGFAIGTGTKAVAGAISNTTGSLTTSSKQARVMISLKPVSLLKSIIAGVGSFAMIRNPANLKTASRLVAAQGTFTLTGGAATFAKHLGRTLHANTGMFSTVGFSANLRRHVGRWSIERRLAPETVWTKVPPLEQ